MKRMPHTYSKLDRAPMDRNLKEDETVLESNSERHSSDGNSETKHPISEEEENYSQNLSPRRLSASSSQYTDKAHQSENPNVSDEPFFSRIDPAYRLTPDFSVRKVGNLTSPSREKSFGTGHASLSKIKTKSQTTKGAWDVSGSNVATSRSVSTYSPYNPSTSRSGVSYKSLSVSSWKSVDAVDTKDNLKKSSTRKKMPAKKSNDSRLTGTSQKNFSPILKAFSSDPFKDFQDAMVDIVLDKDLKSLVDLEEFFDCYLQLTSPSYQDLVNQFFSDFCNELLLPESPVAQNSDDVTVSESLDIQDASDFKFNSNADELLPPSPT